jgi:hypothetical protein
VVTTATLLLGLTGFLVACATERTLDTSDVEDSLEEDFLTIEAVPIGPARCPDEVDEAVGGTFECTLEIAGQELLVVATVSDRDGEVTLEQQQEVVVTAELNEQVRTQLAEELGTEVAVLCDERPALVLEPESRLTCRATDTVGATLDVEVELGPEGIAVVRLPAG